MQHPTTHPSTHRANTHTSNMHPPKTRTPNTHTHNTYTRAHPTHIHLNTQRAHTQHQAPTCTCQLPPCRSAYSPVKDVVDGDLCEQYPQLPADKQRQVRASGGGAGVAAGTGALLPPLLIPFPALRCLPSGQDSVWVRALPGAVSASAGTPLRALLHCQTEPCSSAPAPAAHAARSAPCSAIGGRGAGPHAGRGAEKAGGRAQPHHLIGAAGFQPAVQILVLGCQPPAASSTRSRRSAARARPALPLVRRPAVGLAAPIPRSIVKALG